MRGVQDGPARSLRRRFCLSINRLLQARHGHGQERRKRIKYAGREMETVTWGLTTERKRKVWRTVGIVLWRSAEAYYAKPLGAEASY